MLKYLSGEFRSRRTRIPVRIRQAQEEFRDLAKTAIFRADATAKTLEIEIAILDAGDKLELFWHAPHIDDWYMAHDLSLELVRDGDAKTVVIPLSKDLTGFHALYRMRGAMPPVVPQSHYFNLEAGAWNATITATLQYTRPLCLFADSIGDAFHYVFLKHRYDNVTAEMRKAEFAGGTDEMPMEPVRLSCGTLKLSSDRTAPIRFMLRDRLHHTLVSYQDVADVPVPPVVPPRATAMDPVNFFVRQIAEQLEQSRTFSHCPYGTHCFFNLKPEMEVEHVIVAERISSMYMELTMPVFRATGDPVAYRTARRWYEMNVRNFWPSPNGGLTTGVGRTQFGTVLGTGIMSDALAEFAHLHPDPKRWVEPIHQSLLNWPFDPKTDLPIMDQDYWGNEGNTTSGTYNMISHFAVGMWRVGHIMEDARLTQKADRIITEFVLPAMGPDGIWYYRPGGKYRAPHYDLYVKWQMARLVMTNTERWTNDRKFLEQLAVGVEGSLETHKAFEDDTEIVFDECMTQAEAKHPANRAAAGGIAMSPMLALAVYHDDRFLVPLTKTLRGIYRLLSLPEAQNCWKSSWWRANEYLMSLAEHGVHVEGTSHRDLRCVITEKPKPAGK